MATNTLKTLMNQAITKTVNNAAAGKSLDMKAEASSIAKGQLDGFQNNANNAVLNQVNSMSGNNTLINGITQVAGQTVLSKVPALSGLTSMKSTSLGKVVFGESASDSSLFRNLQSVGTTTNDGEEQVDSRYKIYVSSAQVGKTVEAVLQDKISLKITSEWEPFLPLGTVSQVANSATQLVGGVSLLSRFMTRRIWKGTSPIGITITLQFESINNTYNDVVDPVISLMKMALPYEDNDLQVFGAKIPLVSPPGPSPFTTGNDNVSNDQKLSTGDVDKIANSLKKGDQISIKIGNFMKFDSVIISEVTPEVSNRMSVDGFPISASVSISFETYEIITRETLSSRILMGRG